MNTPVEPPAPPSRGTDPSRDGPWAGVEVVDPAALVGVTEVNGPALGRALQVDPTTLTPAQLVELLTGAERLIRWCQGVQLEAVAELVNYSDPSLRQDGPVSPGWANLARAGATERTVERGFSTPQEVGEFLSDGLSCALGIGLISANALIDSAIAARDCSDLTTMMADGVIDLGRVKAVAQEFAPLRDDPELPDLTAQLVSRNAQLTPGKFRDKLRQTVAERLGATDDHLVQRARRRLWIRKERSGMATLGAYLPAEDALLAWETLTSAAIRSHADAEAAEGSCQDRTDGDEGYCAPHGGTLSLDNQRADTFLDIIRVEHAALVDATTGALDDQTGDPARFQRRNKRRDQSPLQVHLHLNESTLIGADDLPGHLVGYGTIDADHARRISENATLVRILTDPVSGEITAMDTPNYRIPKKLRWAVQSRDGYCVFPTCDRTAHTGQIDHREPHPGGRATRKLEALGLTSYSTLQSLCTRHHRLKTHGGWTVYDLGDGRLEWHSPDGRVYHRDLSFTPRELNREAQWVQARQRWKKHYPDKPFQRLRPTDRPVALAPDAPPPF